MDAAASFSPVVFLRLKEYLKSMATRFLAFCLLACLAGCGEPNRTEPAAPEPADQAAETSGGSDVQRTDTVPETNVAAAASEAELAAVISQLTQVVRKYAVEKQRVPKSLEELVQQGYLQSIPQAPAGQVFAIDKQLQVYLGKR